MFFRFQYPYLLAGLLILPVLIFLFVMLLRWKKQTAIAAGDPGLIQQLVHHFSAAKFFTKFLLMLAAVAFIIAAMANPQVKGDSEKVKRQGVDIMIALDVSKSMLAEDIKPSRLERAKQFIHQLIQRSSNDRIGLILFAGRAYIQMPLTTDHAAANMYVQAAAPDAVPTQGTVISEALRLCGSTFNTKEKRFNAIVLISDGEDHDPEAISTAKSLSENGVVIHTVGVGSADGAPLIEPGTNDFKKDRNGNNIISRLNETILRDIAGSSKGKYSLLIQPAATAEALRTQLSAMEQNNISGSPLVQYKSLFQWFIALVILLLLIELLLPEVRKYNRQFSNSLLPILLLSPFLVQAQTSNTIINKGNRFYQQQAYDKAIREYQKLFPTDAGNATAWYNQGNALYRNNQPGESLSSYDKAIAMAQNSATAQKAWYNKGVVLARENKLPEAIDAFKKSVQLKQEDTEARQNLQKAIEALKKQQKEQEQQKQQQQQPTKKQEQESKLSKQKVEQLLNAMQQKERALQKKMQAKNASPAQPEKDW